VVVALFAIVVQIALPALHDVASCPHGVPAHAIGTHVALRTSDAPSRHPVHDPATCPVCTTIAERCLDTPQLVAPVAAPTLAVAERPLPLRSLVARAPDLTAAPPRAPPALPVA
jgi:hypothetical protein